MRLVNLGLMRHPVNWATIFLMAIIGVFAVNSAFKCFLQNKDQ